MVDLTKKVFALAGGDFTLRAQALADLTRQLLGAHAASLNTYTVYPKKLHLQTLQEQLARISFDVQKIVVFKDARHLDAHARAYITGALGTITKHNWLVFEIEDASEGGYKKNSADEFIDGILKHACVIKTGSFTRQPSIDTLKQAVKKGDYAQAVAVLGELFENVAPSQAAGLAMQIVGMFVWLFDDIKNPVRRRQCMDILFGAERMLKSFCSDNPRLVLELALAKLVSTRGTVA